MTSDEIGKTAKQNLNELDILINRIRDYPESTSLTSDEKYREAVRKTALAALDVVERSFNSEGSGLRLEEVNSALSFLAIVHGAPAPNSIKQ